LLAKIQAQTAEDAAEEAPAEGGDEPTATNPTTGEKMAYRNGKWVPYK